MDGQIGSLRDVLGTLEKDVVATFWGPLFASWDANYEYNTRHGLERWRDYYLTMIIGCKNRLSF